MWGGGGGGGGDVHGGPLWPTAYIGLFFGVCVVLVLSVIICSFYFLDRVLFHHDTFDGYWNFMATMIILDYTFMLPETKLWFCKCTPPWVFRPWAFPLNIGLTMLPSDSFMACLYALLGYSTGEFQVLQLIVLAMFGAVDYPLASCGLVHFWKFSLKCLTQWRTIFHCFRLCFTYILMPQNMIRLYFRLSCFHLSNITFVFT